MERVPEEHLSAEQLLRLYESDSQRQGLALQVDADRAHLEACPACQERYQENSVIDQQIENLRMLGKTPRRADCPDEQVWYEIAGGVTPPEEVPGLIRHASACDHCGPWLRQAVSDLNVDATKSERKEIAALPSASREWQRNLARRIVGADPSGAEDASRSWWTRWVTAPALAMAGAALLVIASALWWGLVRQDRLTATNQLLARAYTDQRTLELRFAGAAYAPLRVQRGPAQSFVERSANLLKAESLISSQLSSHLSDPAWLQAKAQADLLEGKYDAAVESLKRALELEPHSAGLLLDLATAYFQRARQEGRPQDCGAAYEYLSQVLAQDPDNAVALYNRALVAEQQFLYHQALEDWEHFLKVDPRSEWAEEARSRADALRAKLKEHENRSQLLKPGEIAAFADSPSAQSEVDDRVEEYLQEAVLSWLPNAYPEVRATADPQAVQALFFLADLTSRKHSDHWLADLLRGSSQPAFPQAVGALARADHANDSGEHGIAREQAARAEQLFRASGNVAGVLRAQFEQAFSKQILRRVEECGREAAAALRESEKHAYPWLDIQLGLEKGVCAAIAGDLGASQRAVDRAVTRARQSGYGGLYLRALGFLADTKFATGDPNGAWQVLDTGLARFWSGQFSAIRGYNLYAFLAENASETDRPNLQLAARKEAIALVESSDDSLLRAGAHGEAARAAAAARQSHVAEQYYGEAARLYALVPQSEAVRALRLYEEIQAAQLESQQGHFDAAFAHLTRVQSETRRLSDNYLALLFYSTLGQLQLRRHHELEAEQALRPALALAEQSLASLNSETDRANWSRDAAPVYLALAEAQLMQGRGQEALDVFEWYLGASQRAGADWAENHRQYASLSSPGPDPAWLTFRLPMLSKETVVAYGVLPDGLAIWTYDDRGVDVQWISKAPHEIEELVDRFCELASDPRSELSAVRRDSRSLYEVLIAPVEEKLARGRTLLFEADGWLARVPFEALLDPSGHYLTERGPIVHSHGQYAEARLHAETTISPDSPALIVGSAASSQADDLIPLPDVTAEAETVARDFVSPRVLKGPNATLSSVKSELPQASVFHFAGHSLVISGKAGLLLQGEDAQSGTPSLLDTSVLDRLKLQQMQLAVLSACSTESGRGGSGAFNSVAEALQRSGVPHVVASRWAVDSVEARAFVEDFYRNLLSGQSVSNAIQLTSRKMLSDPRTAHPYYWSAFAAYGRP